jgi:hypothetical protein
MVLLTIMSWWHYLQKHLISKYLHRSYDRLCTSLLLRNKNLNPKKKKSPRISSLTHLISCVTIAESGGRGGPSSSCSRALRGDPQVASQVDRLRRRHTPSAAHPSLARYPGGRHSSVHTSTASGVPHSAFFTPRGRIVVYLTVSTLVGKTQPDRM